MNIIQKIMNHKIEMMKEHKTELNKETYEGEMPDHTMLARLQGNIECCDYILLNYPSAASIIAELIDSLSSSEMAGLRHILIDKQVKAEQKAKQLFQRK